MILRTVSHDLFQYNDRKYKIGQHVFHNQKIMKAIRYWIYTANTYDFDMNLLGKFHLCASE